MILYNITTKVHSSIDEAWRQWQRDVYIPAIMGTGFFSSYQLLRLMDQDDSEGYTYAVQYSIPSVEHYNKYIQLHAPVFRKQATDKWGNLIISFHSTLEVVH